jgi:hypothetical protein
MAVVLLPVAGECAPGLCGLWDVLLQECEQLAGDLIGSFLLDPVAAAGDDHGAQSGDSLFHGCAVDEAGGGVASAPDEQSGLGDGRDAESPEISPVAVKVAVAVERAGEPGPPEFGRVVAEVIAGQPGGKLPGFGDGIKEAGTSWQPAEQPGSQVLTSAVIWIIA